MRVDQAGMTIIPEQSITSASADVMESDRLSLISRLR